MGRRLNITQPTIIKTELTPLSDMFDVVPSDTLEQWYYVNTGSYKPNRRDTPLILTPTIQAKDVDSGETFRPSFNLVNWYYFDPSSQATYPSDNLWPGAGWVPITAVADGSGVDYYCPVADTNPDRYLVVKRNVPAATASVGGQTLCCVATYIDPRDVAVTYMVKKTILLVTNRDATIDNIRIDIQAPPSQKYNVFTSPTSIYEFEAVVYDEATNQDVTSSYYIEWYGVLNNSTTEVLIQNLACYAQASQTVMRNGVALTKGQGTNIVVVDAMYADELSLVCYAKKTSSSDKLPAKAYASLVWDMPKIDAMAVCSNGDVVNEIVRDMEFGTIINLRGKTLTDEEKAAHLLINWKRRISTSGTFTDMGWGQQKKVSSNTLKQTVSYSTPVHAEIYLIGPYEEVTDSGDAVTDDSETVFDRN